MQDAEGSDKTLPADLVVLAMGVHSDQSLCAELEAEFDRVVLVGDAQHPGQIREALHGEGHCILPAERLDESVTRLVYAALRSAEISR